MLTRRPSDIAPSEITPREVYLRRREFIAGAAALGLGAGLSAGLPASRARAAPLQAAKSPLSTTDEPVTPLKDIASYIVLLIVLVVCPQGLFGSVGRKKV